VPLVPAWRVDKPFDYLVPPDMDVRVGSVVGIPFGHRKVRGVVIALGESADDRELQEIARLVVPVPMAPAPLDELLEWIAVRYTTPRGRVFDRVVPARVRASVPAPAEGTPASPEPSRLLALERGAELAEAVRSGAPGAWVLRTTLGEDHGLLLAELVGLAVSGGGSALVAVPEVRYGSAVLDSLRSVFPEAVRVDSAVGPQERSKALLALASGARIGLGGRGSVIAPLVGARLIVIDEEHHRSFKEDRAPRFDARRVALERARMEGGLCVLVSSTPSLEAGWAAKSGALGYVHPSPAIARAAHPIVEVAPPSEFALGPELHRAMREHLRDGRKVGLLVPRGGYARALWCASCRRSLRCSRCEAGMIFERSLRRVRCPRCNLTAAPPGACPHCRAHDFRYLGAGSERLAEQLAKMFPRSRVQRMDPEELAASGQDAPDTSQADIYVTTWIGTKPVLRPDVSLVGVIDADALIRRPDFRAAEQAYQAFTEMAEWAGPRGEGGRLIIQTSEPGHHSIQAVVRGDYSFFLEKEAEQRRELSYPPFGELVRLRASGTGAEELAQKAATTARAAGGKVLGPIEVREQAPDGPPGAAFEMLVKCPDAYEVAAGLRVILPGLSAGSRLRIDVDPR
jgi:primosomal protein N' (replication factor Y)